MIIRLSLNSYFPIQEEYRKSIVFSGWGFDTQAFVKDKLSDDEEEENIDL